MKLIGVFSTAVLSLAIAAPVYAQQEQHDQQEEQKDKPADQKEKKAQPEKSAKPEEKSAQPEKNTKPEEKSAQQPEKATKPEERNAQQQDKNNKPEEKNAQQQQAQPEKQAQRGGGGRIPDDRYKANFGQQHTFHVSQGDYNNHRFQYGGYSFGFVGVWPSNWLYTQNVYVIDIDGVYYLCNPMYPGVNIALEVAL
jgi:cytoskeletal protein RodZ